MGHAFLAYSLLRVCALDEVSVVVVEVRGELDRAGEDCVKAVVGIGQGVWRH